MTTQTIWYSILLIAITAFFTFLLRLLPFLIFKNGESMPKLLKKVSAILPPSIMVILIIYCLKNDILTFTNSTIASSIALALVVILHVWKRNILLSIFVGTVTYMICLRLL
ncbi:MAG: branched-chain amino acid transporter permease [Lachnospiraceae bacterium]